MYQLTGSHDILILISHTYNGYVSKHKMCVLLLVCGHICVCYRLYLFLYAKDNVEESPAVKKFKSLAASGKVWAE